MPVRYLINTVLIVGLWVIMNAMIANGTISNYWRGILITAGINIILATSLNISVGYLGQLPLGHAGFMAVGAYAGSIFMKATPMDEILKSGNTAAAIPYILGAIVISALVAGIFGILIGIPALRIIALTFPFAAYTYISGYYCSGLGNAMVNMTGGMLRQVIVLVPLVWFLMKMLGIGGVWYAFWIAEICAFLFCYYRVRKEKAKYGI